MEKINFLNNKPKKQVDWKPIVRIAVVLIGIIWATQATRNSLKLSAATAHYIQKTQTVSETKTLAPRPIQNVMGIVKNAFPWVSTHVDGNSLEVTLNSDSIFQVGSASLNDQHKEDLRDLIKQLLATSDQSHLTIEGHTDDSPIVKHRKSFKTNWELSAARAGAVASIFQDLNFPKNRIEAIGFADTRPVGDEPSQNRRIVLRLNEKTQGGT